jgi:enamine deaminase RidA (YjgF/YER057c/UK114 family)
MPKLEVKSVEKFLGTNINYAYAIKAGPWIFLTGHEAIDFESGVPGEVAGHPGFPSFGLPRFRREGDYILNRIRKTLREFGSDLPNGVRLDQFYKNINAVDPYHLSRQANFGGYIPPSTSVIMDQLLCGSTNISTSMIAIVPGKDWAVTRINTAGINAPPSSGFAPSITCNEFVFVAGQMASDAGGLDPKAHMPEHSRWHGSEIRLQTHYLIKDRLEPALKGAGSSLKQSVKAQVYIQEGLDAFPDFLHVWNEYFAEIPCALTVVPTTDFNTKGGIIEINLIALKDGATRRKEVIKADVPAMASYGPCVKVGEFVFPSGLMAIGPDGYVVGGSRSDDFTTVAHAGAIQAETVYGYAEAYCKAAGTSMQNVVRAQYYTRDARDFSGIASAWIARYGKQPHPFVVVEVPDDLPAPNAAFIADFWIYADS